MCVLHVLVAVHVCVTCTLAVHVCVTCTCVSQLAVGKLHTVASHPARVNCYVSHSRCVWPGMQVVPWPIQRTTCLACNISNQATFLSDSYK